MKKEHTDIDALRAEIEAAERRVAREIEPGPRAFVVAILVFVLLGSFILPHTGAVRGWDVLFSSHGAGAAALGLPSRVFTWLALVISSTSIFASAISWIARWRGPISSGRAH